eukprot:7345045-Alexandrium_andersonii.AAC.1
MSASLVGSEMCIRDSLCHLADDLEDGAVEVPRHHGGHRLIPEDVLVGDPVSYTHLTLPTICSV